MNIVSQLLVMLDKSQRRKAFILTGLMFLSMLLETLSLGLVIPVLAFLSQPEPILPGWLQSTLNNFHAPSRQVMALVGAGAVISIYLIKSLFQTFFVWRQSDFIFSIQASLSKRLFSSYLFQPYAFHLERNSGQLISMVTTQVGWMVGVMQTILIVFTEGLVSLGAALLLLWVEPTGALLVLVVVGVVVWLFNRRTKMRVHSVGNEHRKHEGLRVQHLQQGLGGIKEIKLLGREGAFLDKYDIHNQGAARAGRYQFTLQAMPRIWIELFFIVALTVLVSVMIARGSQAELIIPTLGFFSIVAVRMMPSINRAVSSYQGARFAFPAISIMSTELVSLESFRRNDTAVPMNLSDSIVFDNVEFTYPQAGRPTLKNINLSIHKGSSIGIIGSSGAGKSTLVDLVLGLLKPTRGKILLDGLDIHSNLRGWQFGVGYVPQSIYLADDSIRNNICFGLSEEVIDNDKVARVINLAQLDEFVASLPDGLDTMVGERGVRISGGQRQRLGIARALYGAPNFLVLDEATSSLDIETERAVTQTIKNLHGKETMVIVTHRLDTVRHCERVYRLENAELIDVTGTI